MYKNWCGEKCSECMFPCEFEIISACSADCEFLGEDGYPIDYKKCRECGCDAYEADLSDGEKACHLIDEVVDIINDLPVDEEIKENMRSKMYEIATHLDM